MQIKTLNLILRTPQIKDFSSLKAFENRNQAHLTKWELMSDERSDQIYHDRLKNWKNECDEGRSVRFFIFTKNDPDQIIGMCNFTQIFKGLFQACYLGYKIDKQYEGKGFMFEALQSAIGYIFEDLHLHRVMANYMPINVRSAKLLNRLDFVIEGYAKNYLLINNRWEDHVLTALSYEQWKCVQLSEDILNPKQTSLIMRKATINDLESIVDLLSDDKLGQTRENSSKPLSSSYLKAFSKISSDLNHELIVGEFDHKIIGVMQITYLQHLTFQGALVAHIESVRIQKEYQGKKFGQQMFEWAIKRAKSLGCQRIQLMTDKKRHEAHKFYEKLGFLSTHEGMKLFIT